MEAGRAFRIRIRRAQVRDTVSHRPAPVHPNHMWSIAQRLHKPLRRELSIAGEPWVITISPVALKLTRKGRRKGLELAWKALISGDAALAAALNASVRGSGTRRPSRS